ncbi:hypothetical protein B0T18DRAFT_42385 [Schizothecium vesticola]|uniref:PHD-type domain-containing protein n=1 Tax=Schizothecium vesticola TaxID=314040 RepID=A0AA40KD04_9PEZI|nr:hypothetical protein B0T18DRAFT_42385 [Schizothecium vesticola]
MPSSRKPRLCKFCRDPEEFGKPLFRCVSCLRSYHSHCHSPHPKDKLNWICQRCLNHDSRSSQMPPASLGFGVAAAGCRPPEQSSSAMARFAPITGSSARSLQCSFPDPDCAELAVPGHVFCLTHLRSFGIVPIKSSRKSTPSSTPGPELQQPPPPPTGSATNGTAPVPPAKNKALPEHDRDRPIVRRKTAARADQHSQIQPSFSSSRHATGSSFVRNPTAISASPSAPRPAAVSPLGSPEYAQNGQSSRKRPRLSPPSGSPSPDHRIDSPAPLGTGRPKAIKTATTRVTFAAGSLHELNTKSPTRLNSNICRPVSRKTAPGILNYYKEDLASGRKALPDAPSKNSNPEQSRGQNGHASGKQGREFLEKNGVWSFHDKGVVEQPDVRPSRESERDGPLTPKRSKPPNGTNGYPYPKSEADSRGESRKPQAVSSWPTDSTQGGLARSLGNGSEQANGRVFAKIAKPPPLQQPERQRHPLDLSEFDRLIYAQEGALKPPSEVCLVTSPATSSTEAKSNDSDHPPQDEPLYLDIDPRIHWPQPHTESWLAKRQAEIEARGGRKANFGQAAQRLRQQRIAEEAVQFEDTLPEKMASNPAWVKMLKRLKAIEEDVSTISGAACTATKGTAGPGRGRRPVLGKKQSSSLCPSVDGVSPVEDGSQDESVYTSE